MCGKQTKVGVFLQVVLPLEVPPERAEYVSLTKFLSLSTKLLPQHSTSYGLAVLVAARFIHP